MLTKMAAQKPISIHEVARKAGFSIATVSNVLNGKGRISQQTRKKVVAAAEALGYTPSCFGRQLRLRQTETVGLLFYPNCAQLFLNVYYTAIMAGVEESLEKLNYDLLLSSYERKDSADDSMPKFIHRRKVDGLILLGNFPKPTIKALADTGFPLLMLDSHTEGIPVDSITTDGFSAGAMIARHLADFGHTQIAFLGYESDDFNAMGRRRGFITGMEELGLPTANIQIRARVARKERFGNVLKALESKKPPTALFVENDTLAFELIEFLKKNTDLRIPKDVSVVGFDNSHHAVESSPQLTTVGIDQQALGRFGAEAIVSRIQNPQSPRRSFRLPVTLVERESVAPPSS